MINKIDLDIINNNLTIDYNASSYGINIGNNFLESLNYKIHRLNGGKNIVVGNGLIANAFLGMNIDKQVVIFASGVSNSNENDDYAFEKEKKLLMDINKYFPEHIFIYFGSCSIFDPGLQNKKYVQHKKNIELLISQNISHYTIVRLPIIVGKSDNPNTLTNYLYNNIIKNNKFNVRKNAKRYIVDIEDVYPIVEQLLLNNGSKNRTIDIALYQYTIIEIINKIEEITGKIALYDVVDEGGSYNVNTEVIEELLPDIKSLSDKFYLDKTLRKHYSI